MMAFPLASKSLAQNIMRIRFDTVTAKPGDTVTVNVYYTFTATHGHDIQDFRVRMQYDASRIHEYRYIMDGTASAAFFDTTGSRVGILAIGNQELDLTNPVLIRVQFVVDSSITDTAWIRWDSVLKYPGLMFEQTQDSVDSVVLQDGWIRVPPKAAVREAAPDVQRLSIYPNPARDAVMLNVPEMQSEESIEVQVFDALGRICWKGTVPNGRWDLPRALLPGTYTVVAEANKVFYRGRVTIEPH